MPQKPFNWLTGLSYGPIVGEHSPATNYGPGGNPLGSSDVAASPNILAAHPLGSTFTYNGKTYTIADTSYYSPGNPTSNTLEFRDTADNQRINPSDISWDPASGGIWGKIAARLPGGRAYLAGQAIYNAITGARNRGIPDNLQPITPNYNYAPGMGPPEIPDNLQPTTPPYNSPPGMGPPDPNAPAPWLMPSTTNVPFGMHLPGQGVDPGYIDPRSANSFIAGLIDWNGPGQANPSGSEGFDPSLRGEDWNARHDIGALLARFGLSGHGGGGKMPVGFQ